MKLQADLTLFYSFMVIGLLVGLSFKSPLFAIAFFIIAITSCASALCNR